LIFNDIIVIGLEAFFELLFCGALESRINLMNSNGEVMGSVTGYFCLILTLVFLPTVLIVIQFLSKSKLQDKIFEQRWGGLYYLIKLDDPF